MIHQEKIEQRRLVWISLYLLNISLIGSSKTSITMDTSTNLITNSTTSSTTSMVTKSKNTYSE